MTVRRARSRPNALQTAAAAESHLWQLHLLHEARAQVLQHNAVGGGEEGEHVEDEVLLVAGELLPVAEVIAKIHLLRCGDQVGARQQQAA